MARLGLFRGSADQLRGFRQKGPDASRVLFCFSYSFSVLRCFETDSSAGSTLDGIWQGMDRSTGPGSCFRPFEPPLCGFARPLRKCFGRPRNGLKRVSRWARFCAQNCLARACQARSNETVDSRGETLSRTGPPVCPGGHPTRL